MSFFSYFMSENPLPVEVTEKARSMHFSLSDITKFVKDARANFKYYNFDPASIYIPSTNFKLNRKDPYSCRSLSLDDFYKWIINEFRQNGNFKYIQFMEDNTKIVNGLYEEYFEKCKQEDIQLSKFFPELINSEYSLKYDVLYNVIVN